MGEGRGMSNRPPRASPGDAGPDRVARLEQLDAAIERLICVFEAIPSPDQAVDDAWTARDVIGHLAFWHESFARNVDDLANDRVPTPLRGRLGDLNDRGVAEMRGRPVEEIVLRLLAAQAVVRAGILSPRLGLIPYRVGSRPYAPGEHLEVVRDHVAAHLRGLESLLRQESRTRPGRPRLAQSP
jgi:hypothetical protein